MPYWNKYPLRDRALDHQKPVMNLTSRGMGVPERFAASLNQSAEVARLEAERLADAGLATIPLATEGAKPL